MYSSFYNSVADLVFQIPHLIFFHPGSRVKKIPDPGIGSASKNLFYYFFPKILSKLWEIWSEIFLPDPDLDFYLSRIPDFRVKKAPDPGSATLFSNIIWLSYVGWSAKLITGDWLIDCSAWGLIDWFFSVKEEAGGLSEDGVGGLPFSDADFKADFKPEDIKLDASCDFGNGKFCFFFVNFAEFFAKQKRVWNVERLVRIWCQQLFCYVRFICIFFLRYYTEQSC